MKMEGIETEEVKIDNWLSSLPSELCTNKEIFNQVFSIDTWNNVLGTEQRERLIGMFPKEIRGSPELLTETVEDFFTGKLGTFSHTPLDTFFQRLETGQYDPVVADLKVNIKKELKKEGIRQLKNYHAKLLEDIVVSRHRHLTKLKAKIANNNGKSVKPSKSKKQTAGVLQNASSELNTKTVMDGGDLISVEKPRPVVIIKTEETNGQHIPVPGSRKRKGKEPVISGKVGEESSGRVPAKMKGKAQKLAPEAIDKNPSLHTEGSIQLQLQGIESPTENANPNPPSIPATQAGFTFVSRESILNAALTGDKSFKSSGGISSSSFETNTSKSSPILASQLQGSPQISVKLEDGLGLFSSGTESDSGCITLNYQKLDEKTGELESMSSSHELEAIQPTIGFSTSLSSSTISSMLNTSPMSKVVMASSGSSLQAIVTSASNLISSGTVYSNPIVQVQNSVSQQFQSSGNLVTVTVPNSGQRLSQGNPVYVLNTKAISESSQQGRIVQISKDSMKTIQIPIPNQQLAVINSPKIVVKADQQQFLQKGITLSSTSAGQKPEIIRISNTDLLNAKSSGGVHYVTSSGKSLILHPITSPGGQPGMKLASISTQVPMSSSTPLRNLNLSLSTSPTRSLHIPSNQLTQIKLHDNLSLNSSLLENDDLNLSLGSLSSIGVVGMSGGNLSNTSLEGIMGGDHMDTIDKIEDLSVLDGNPFDSIPNLSDELDGLDLEMVDGLCDFEGLLQEDKKYPSFFSLIRDVICSTRDHRMNFVCLEKTIKKWSGTSGAAMNAWYITISDWSNALLTALNFLAGTYQEVHPEDFVPYIEYKYKTKYYQWIGAGRDGDNNLTPLSSIWMENMEKLPRLKKLDGETDDPEEEDEENEDSETAGEDLKKKNKRPITPPPPRVLTDWTVQASTEDEKIIFREQERQRFENPHKAFTYQMHGYESVVGPVKGVYSSQVGLTNKARGHTLLVDDRPPYVTVLALVRDAVARLPNGEGTRSEICEMLRDSQFLNPDASSVTLNSVVSGALDRLHYERDPCVRYDSHKKSWIYLHRDRTQEQFERLHHNRSYTKSTKSRHSSSRKSRKSSSKPGTSTLVSVAAIPTSSNSSTASSSGTNASALSSGAQLVLASETLGGSSQFTSSSTSTSTSSPQLLQAIQKSSTPTSVESGNVGLSEVEITDEIPKTSVQTVKLELVSAAQPDTAPVFNRTENVAEVPKLAQQLISQPSTAVSIQSPISQTRIAQIQLQPATVTSGMHSVQVSNNTSTIPSSSVGSTSTVTQQPTLTLPQMSQGQVLLGPQTVLQIANALRLSNIRLPGTTVGGNLRAPQQHRILLTRGPVPGQGQGILLGQTATGQTVILSTGPPGSGSFQQMIGGSQAATIQVQHSPSTTVPSVVIPGTTAATSAMSSPLIRPVLSKTGSATIGTIVTSTKPPANTNVSTVVNPNTSQPSKVMQLSVANMPSTSTAPKPGSIHVAPMHSRPGTISIAAPVRSAAEKSNIGTIAMPTGLTAPRQSVGYTFAAIRGNTVSQGYPPSTRPTAVVQTLSQNFQGQAVLGQGQGQTPTVISTGSNAEEGNQGIVPTTTTPIIIRSAQGDLMLQGQLAMGKGGIKLIPLPGGNRTMLAKFIQPSSSNPGGLQSIRLPVTMTVTTCSSSVEIPATVTSSSLLTSANSSESQPKPTNVTVSIETHQSPKQE